MTQGAGARRIRLPFVSRCPSCERELPQWYTDSELLRLLYRGHPVEGYCVTCDAYWQITAYERDGRAAKLAG